MLIEDKRQVRDDGFRRKLNDWISYWQDRVGESPEVKARHVYGFFAGFWYAHTLSITVPPEVWWKAEKRAVLYFQKYNNRVLPNPMIWKNLFPEPTQAPHSKEMRHLSRTLAEDIDMSKRYS